MVLISDDVRLLVECGDHNPGIFGLVFARSNGDSRRDLDVCQVLPIRPLITGRVLSSFDGVKIRTTDLEGTFLGTSKGLVILTRSTFETERIDVHCFVTLVVDLVSQSPVHHVSTVVVEVTHGIRCIGVEGETVSLTTITDRGLSGSAAGADVNTLAVFTLFAGRTSLRRRALGLVVCDAFAVAAGLAGGAGFGSAALGIGGAVLGAFATLARPPASTVVGRGALGGALIRLAEVAFRTLAAFLTLRSICHTLAVFASLAVFAVGIGFAAFHRHTFAIGAGLTIFAVGVSLTTSAGGFALSTNTLLTTLTVGVGFATSGSVSLTLAALAAQALITV